MAVRNRLLDLQSSEVMLVEMGCCWVDTTSDWDQPRRGEGGGEKLTAILHDGREVSNIGLRYNKRIIKRSSA